MNHTAKVYVAGHRGLVGSAIMQILARNGFSNVVTRRHDEVDLTHQAAVRELFSAQRPEYVFLAAAKVGGILANDKYPADFISQNLAIQTNVIQECWRSGVKRLLFLGSSCLYPRDCTQPIKEQFLLTGPLEPTNRPYAVAKIAGVEMCRAYNRQFDTRYIAAMPTNLFGPGDNYDLNSSHVLAALIRKFHEATQSNARSVVVWGTGTPRREFLHSEDMAEAALFLMTLCDERIAQLTAADRLPLVNVGTGKDISICELAKLIAKITGFGGNIVFDHSKPDGTPRKLLDVSLMSGLGWSAKTDLEAGIRSVYRDFMRPSSAGRGLKSLERQR
jgi:GDP-L-fucose synthase